MNNFALKNLSRWNRLMTEILGLEELVKYIDPSFTTHPQEIFDIPKDFELSSNELNLDNLDQFLSYLITYLIQEKLQSNKNVSESFTKTTHTESIQALNDSLLNTLLREKLNNYPNENYDTEKSNSNRCSSKHNNYRKQKSVRVKKAVGAVLNGSMSVVRAGSRYGMPHSAIEYNVKERTVFQQKTTNYEIF